MQFMGVLGLAFASFLAAFVQAALMLRGLAKCRRQSLAAIGAPASARAGCCCYDGTHLRRRIDADC